MIIINNNNNAGDVSGPTQIPMACKDSVAMFFMFDLTSRCTLSRYEIYFPLKNITFSLYSLTVQ